MSGVTVEWARAESHSHHPGRCPGFSARALPREEVEVDHPRFVPHATPLATNLLLLAITPLAHAHASMHSTKSNAHKPAKT